METFDSPFGRIELTDERWSHIITFHPEVHLYHKYLDLTLVSPDFVQRSKLDPAVKICYHFITRSRYFAVVVKTNQRNFILTAYITTKVQPKSI